MYSLKLNNIFLTQLSERVLFVLSRGLAIRAMPYFHTQPVLILFLSGLFIAVADRERTDFTVKDVVG